MKKLSIFVLLFSLCTLSVKASFDVEYMDFNESALAENNGLSDESIITSAVMGMFGVWSGYKAAKHFFKPRNNAGNNRGLSDDSLSQAIRNLGSEGQQNNRPYILGRDLAPVAFYGVLSVISLLGSLAIVSG